MKLTKKLLSFLNRVFDKDPVPFLALRVNCDGTGMTWYVSDAVLTLMPVGGSASEISIDLTQYTVGQLAGYIAAQPGYVVLYADSSELSVLGAGVLIDSSGDVAKSNGDHLYGYTNETWSYLEATARELNAASEQIKQMLLQMSTTTAGDVWLDELGKYYNVPRQQGELDANYARRIIAEVLRPIANNVAIEAAISEYTGQTVTVTDVVEHTPGDPLYNGAHLYDGSVLHNSGSTARYGLFDVELGYDLLNGGDLTQFQTIVRGLINRMRDAGTHLRQMLLKGSVLQDTAPMPTDGPIRLQMQLAVAFNDSVTIAAEMLTSVLTMGAFTDTMPPPTEDANMQVTYNTLYNGLRRYDGKVAYSSGLTISEALVG